VSEKEYLFVYGVFRDYGRAYLGDATFCGKATVQGKIYKVNEFYPGFIPGDGEVIGSVYLIDPSIFEKLDEFEGEEFLRTKIKTSTDILCWIYQFKDDVSKFKEIKGGDWMLR